MASISSAEMDTSVSLSAKAEQTIPVGDGSIDLGGADFSVDISDVTMPFADDPLYPSLLAMPSHDDPLLTNSDSPMHTHEVASSSSYSGAEDSPTSAELEATESRYRRLCSEAGQRTPETVALPMDPANARMLDDSKRLQKKRNSNGVASILPVAETIQRLYNDCKKIGIVEHSSFIELLKKGGLCDTATIPGVHSGPLDRISSALIAANNMPRNFCTPKLSTATPTSAGPMGPSVDSRDSMQIDSLLKSPVARCALPPPPQSSPSVPVQRDMPKYPLPYEVQKPPPAEALVPSAPSEPSLTSALKAAVAAPAAPVVATAAPVVAPAAPVVAPAAPVVALVMPSIKVAKEATTLPVPSVSVSRVHDAKQPEKKKLAVASAPAPAPLAPAEPKEVKIQQCHFERKKSIEYATKPGQYPVQVPVTPLYRVRVIVRNVSPIEPVLANFSRLEPGRVFSKYLSVEELIVVDIYSRELQHPEIENEKIPHASQCARLVPAVLASPKLAAFSKEEIDSMKRSQNLKRQNLALCVCTRSFLLDVADGDEEKLDLKLEDVHYNYEQPLDILKPTQTMVNHRYVCFGESGCPYWLPEDAVLFPETTVAGGTWKTIRVHLERAEKVPKSRLFFVPLLHPAHMKAADANFAEQPRPDQIKTAFHREYMIDGHPEDPLVCQKMRMLSGQPEPGCIDSKLKKLFKSKPKEITRDLLFEAFGRYHSDGDAAVASRISSAAETTEQKKRDSVKTKAPPKKKSKSSDGSAKARVELDEPSSPVATWSTESSPKSKKTTTNKLQPKGSRALTNATITSWLASMSATAVETLALPHLYGCTATGMENAESIPRLPEEDIPRVLTIAFTAYNTPKLAGFIKKSALKQYEKIKETKSRLEAAAVTCLSQQQKVSDSDSESDADSDAASAQNNVACSVGQKRKSPDSPSPSQNDFVPPKTPSPFTPKEDEDAPENDGSIVL